MDPVWKVVASKSTFGIVFSKEWDCEAWKKVGATPLSQACLLNQKQVSQEMGDAKDTANDTMQLIQSANDHLTFFLKENSFNSDVLNASSKKVKTKLWWWGIHKNELMQ